ncbi:MAG: metallophosphoesterase [Paludibacteraceae bacterium]|nr:metallophosphoesterase [Paludibacteraceae bacterium]
MKSVSSYNIIGDIHARTCWKNLVREDSVNIFVGDYFDSYEYIPPSEQMSNFQELLAFKRQHPETVLLYGNHDLHYMIANEHYSRYDVFSANNYWHAFLDSRSLFHGVAYPIEDKALVTHAGVTRDWYEKYIGIYHSESLAEVARRINALWNTDKQAFAFETNATGWEDHYGTSPTHSPVWIRPWVLKEHDLFAGTGIKQIFGHTQTEAGVMSDCNLICVDCLGTKEKSYMIEA